MTVAWLLIGDGRDAYHDASLGSLEENLPDPDYVIRVDDPEHRLGFAGAIQAGWDRVLQTDAEWVWHGELDFTLNRPVPLDDMIAVLQGNRHLTQLALLRQPWNRAEKLAGGIWQQHPDSYTRHGTWPRQWMEHARHWTTNPCLYPRWVAERGWPQVPQSEGMFGLKLFAEDPARRAAYWGAGEEWCTHVGQERAGTGY